MSEFSDLFLVIKELIQSVKSDFTNQNNTQQEQLDDLIKKVDIICPAIRKLQESAKQTNKLLAEHNTCWQSDHSPKALKQELSDIQKYVESNKCPKWFLLLAKLIKKITGLD